MTAPISWSQRLRFFLTTGVLYIGAVSLLGYIGVLAYAPQPVSITTPTITQSHPTATAPTASTAAVIYGKPVRLVVADAGIDLPIDEGYYDATLDTWTLSDTRLQYAMMTMPAKNQSGNTFIYGHGTPQVLEPLAKAPLTDSSLAQVYTDNGHIFTYSFQSSHNFTPSDTGIFNYSGPPILTVQTCTGAASEWRTMFTFSFKEVVS